MDIVSIFINRINTPTEIKKSIFDKYYHNYVYKLAATIDTEPHLYQTVKSQNINTLKDLYLYLEKLRITHEQIEDLLYWQLIYMELISQELLITYKTQLKINGVAFEEIDTELKTFEKELHSHTRDVYHWFNKRLKSKKKKTTS